DTDARWPFPWHDRSLWNEKLLEQYKAAIGLRHKYPSLREGRFSQEYAEGSCYVFSRGSGGERLIIGLNAGESSAAINLNVGEYFSDGSTLSVVYGAAGDAYPVQDGRLTVAIPARTGIVLAPSNQPAD
ncbi:MAG: hypothetical protein WA996_22640, partial [Candidatus Promineifilaceae bacterium]